MYLKETRNISVVSFPVVLVVYVGIVMILWSISWLRSSLLKWQILKNCHNRKSQNGRISKTAIINIFKENRTKSILMTVFQKLPHSKWQNFKNRHNRNSQYGRISKTATKLITWEKLTNILKWQNFRNIF